MRQAERFQERGSVCRLLALGERSLAASRPHWKPMGMSPVQVRKIHTELHKLWCAILGLNLICHLLSRCA